MPGKEEFSSVEGATDDSKAAPERTKKCLRIVVLGGAGVGKTAVIQQFLYSHFLADYKPTVEDLYTVDYDRPDTSTVTVEILDTSGTYAFPAMRKLAIEKADAFVLVYSASDISTFEQVSDLRDEIASVRRDFDEVPTVIVGNKYDKMTKSGDYDDDDQEMSLEEKTVRHRWRQQLYKCSAKTDVNIVNVFINLMNHANINCTPNIVEEKRRKSLPIYLYKTHNQQHNNNRTLHRHSCTIS